MFLQTGDQLQYYHTILILLAHTQSHRAYHIAAASISFSCNIVNFEITHLASKIDRRQLLDGLDYTTDTDSAEMRVSKQRKVWKAINAYTIREPSEELTEEPVALGYRKEPTFWGSDEE